MHLELYDSKALLALVQASPRAGLHAQPWANHRKWQCFMIFIININKGTSTHFCLRFNPLKLNTKIGNANRNICSWIFNYHILGCWQKALMSNTCTHNERQTKLFANTDLHLKDVKAVAEQLNDELYSILFLNIYLEKMCLLTQWSKNFKIATNMTKIWLKKILSSFPRAGGSFSHF